MPRTFRLLPEEGVFHILTRGNNRQQVFKDNEDYNRYLFLLKLYKEEHKFLLYHYCLMPNHVHLILETTEKTDLARLMKQINLSHLYHFRKKYSYFGHFWQGRYRNLIIEKDSYLLTCGRYVELNPVKAKIVNLPEGYPWSSYQAYVKGLKSNLADLDPLYEALGRTTEERQERYRRLMREEIEEVDLNARFLGSQGFVQRMEETFGVSSLKKERGRPRKD